MSKISRALWVGLILATLILAACAPAPPPAPTAAPPTAAPKPTEAAKPTEAPKPTAAPAQPTPAPKPAVEKKIVIGFTASQTGAQNVLSKKQIEGLQLWLDDVNKAGGIKLKDGSVLKPEMKFYDDESKTDRVQALYTKLINDDKADFLLSPYSSTLVKAALVVSEQYGKLMITAGAADEVTMEQGFKNAYQLYTPGGLYFRGAVDLLGKLDPSAKKIAVVHEKDSFTLNVVAGLQPYAKEKGYDIVLLEGYDSNTTDFAPFINKIAAGNPDAIFGGGHMEGTTLAKQLYEKKVSARYISLLVAPPEPTFADLGEAAVGIVGPSQWEPQVTFSPEAAKAANVPYYGPSAKAFTNAYKAKYNADPSYHSAGGYAQGLILQKAIEDADSTDLAKLVAALDKMDLLTFYGRVKFSTEAKTHGKQIGHDMVYIQWQKDSAGKLVRQMVWPLEAKSADAILRK